jgi:hypothetical protein
MAIAINVVSVDAFELETKTLVKRPSRRVPLKNLKIEPPKVQVGEGISKAEE